MFVSLPNSFVEILILDVMVDGAFERCLNYEGGALLNVISAFYKWLQRDL